MFKEMEEEFDATQFIFKEPVPLVPDMEDDKLKFILEMDLPWGEIGCDLVYKKRDASPGDDLFEWKPLKEDWIKEFYS